MGPQGTLVGRTVLARACGCGCTFSTPPAVSTTAALPTPSPYFQALRRRTATVEADSCRRGTPTLLPPTPATFRSTRQLLLAPSLVFKRTRTVLTVISTTQRHTS